MKTIGAMTMTLFTCTPLDMQSISDDDRTKKLEASYECSGVVKVKVKVKDSTRQDRTRQRDGGRGEVYESGVAGPRRRQSIQMHSARLDWTEQNKTW